MIFLVVATMSDEYLVGVVFVIVLGFVLGFVSGFVSGVGLGG